VKRRKCSVKTATLGVILLLLLGGAGVFATPQEAVERTLYTAGGSRVKTLDPAEADDLSSRNMVASIYDTLLEYDYVARPYRLTPSMLASMPTANSTHDVYKFTLRDDLSFADDRCFAGMPKSARRITAKDVLYSILRIADRRNHSPVYWLFRGKIKGIDAFHAEDSPDYHAGIEGFRILDDFNFEIHLNNPDPRFLYMLAMPNAGVVSKQAVEFYGDEFARHPVGSGPFKLTIWVNDYKLQLDRNPDFRRQYFSEAQTPADRTRPLPLADRVIFYQIKQPMTAYLMFLQGKLDLNALDKDNLDLVSGGGEKLSQALTERGVKLLRTPELEIRYVGFNFADPLLKDNLNLRRAISLAYNVQRRVEHSNYQLIPANGPIPPGVAGFDASFKNPWSANDPELAKEYLVKAGFRDGIDPATGEHLRFTFDQTGNSSAYRQLGELTAADLGKIGIEIESVLNNNPRFYEKLRQGKLQLFRLSWVGDYPDAENFLQLFYSKNINGCNRSGFSDLEYDRMFEAILPMPDSPERTELYKQMVRYLSGKVPWVFEGFPISYQLNQAWLENYLPHDFAFSKWKYLSVDPRQRRELQKTFKPLGFDELNGEE
jgi:ABC-type transport system substrate-binding protein